MFIYLGVIIYSQTSLFAYIIVILCALIVYFKKEYYQMLYATFPFALLHTSNTFLIATLFFIIGLLVTSIEMQLFVKKKKLKITKELFIHLVAKTFYFFPAAIVLIA